MLKDIVYKINILNTNVVHQKDFPVIYSGDKNTAQIVVEVMDLQLTEDMTYNVLITMKDGSFFKIENEDVEVAGREVRYILKDNQVKHLGRSSIQLVVIDELKETASQLLYFDIVGALGDQVVNEILIKGWNDITIEADELFDLMRGAIDSGGVVDLSDYATKAFVAQQLNDLIPEIDLSNYHTKTETISLLSDVEDGLSARIVAIENVMDQMIDLEAIIDNYVNGGERVVNTQTTGGQIHENDWRIQELNTDEYSSKELRDDTIYSVGDDEDV